MASLPASDEKTMPDRPVPARTFAARLRWAASARYWVCLGVLLAAAVGLKAAAWGLGVFLRKEAVPLKQPLQFFDPRKLGPPYELNQVMTGKLEPMTEDMVESLGTRDYIQVYLTDTSKAEGDPTRVALTFITYYTGKPDLVPHDPDACWQAAGYDKVSARTEAVHVAGIGAPGDALPVRVVQFKAGQREQLSGVGSDTATVLYFFHANGHYALTRDHVRESMSNPFQRFAYYAKVEITFSSGGGARAGAEASVAALGPLLERLMPILLHEHLNLDKFESAGKAHRVGT
jgi:hypothetical protein